MHVRPQDIRSDQVHQPEGVELVPEDPNMSCPWSKTWSKTWSKKTQTCHDHQLHGGNRSW